MYITVGDDFLCLCRKKIPINIDPVLSGYGAMGII